MANAYGLMGGNAKVGRMTANLAGASEGKRQSIYHSSRNSSGGTSIHASSRLKIYVHGKAVIATRRYRSVSVPSQRSTAH